MRKMNGTGSAEKNCTGRRPWLGDASVVCVQPFRMIQRNANNLYFAATESSILIPEQAGTVGEIVEAINSSPFLNTYFDLLIENQWNYELVSMLIRHKETARYDRFPVADLALALAQVEPPTEQIADPVEPLVFDRHPEYTALTQEREHPQLTVRAKVTAGDIHPGISRVFEVVKLNRTIALKGFSRLSPDSPSLGSGKALLRRNPFVESANWLPAVRHAGEGILLDFNQEALARWEESPLVNQRLANAANGNLRGLAHGQDLSARFMLLHTFSHLFMQQLVQYSGYTSAALAERIYATPESAGVLLFTAAGDADGTMGGLSELVRSEMLGALIERAIHAAGWCASDPLCSQADEGEAVHQVPNLAACHDCVFVPETACDYSNVGLDRAFISGGLTDFPNEIGFFNSNA